MKLHYGFWNIMLLFPRAIRLLIEVVAVALLVVLLWPIVKYLFIIAVQFSKSLNYLILGGIRFILPIFPVERKYVWDEKIAKCGKHNNIWLQKKINDIQKSKMKDAFHKKIIWIIAGCLYVGAVLPFFHLDKYIPEHYIKRLYEINHFFMDFETKMTVGIENYPPFWIREEETEAGVDIYAEEIPIKESVEPINLKLNTEITYANIRADASIHSDVLYVVSKEEEMLYWHVYEYDSERYWLKVTLPYHDNLEGWISFKVIEPEIIETLDLQN